MTKNINKDLSLFKIYYINLETSKDRNSYMVDMFEKYDISNYEKIDGIRSKSKHPLLNDNQWGCLQSHMKAIKAVAEGPDQYAIIMEDDVDISSLDMWDFSFKQMVDKIGHFDVLQLIRCQFGIFTGLSIKEWDKDDHCAAAYIITKNHAKKIYNLFIKTEDLSHLKNATSYAGPVADNFIYRYGKCLSLVIFKMKLFESQVSIDGILEKECHDCVESLFLQKITLNDIFL